MKPITSLVIGFPPAKLNLGLHVLGRRADGFHDLASVFLPLSGERGWTDVLELEVLDGRTEQGARLEMTGIPVPGNSDDNLVLKAFRLLDDRSGGVLPDVRFRLHKTIPTGAGLGGGSADGTFALRMLNEALDLMVEEDEMASLAAMLGSDCTFFIQDDPAHITGRGERLEAMVEVWDVLEGWHIAVVHPGLHISTQEAFASVPSNVVELDLREVVVEPVSEWARLGMRNSFQAGIAAKHPEIQALLDWMEEGGAAYHAMTGTGSAVFGLFDSAEAAEQIRLRAVDRGWTGFSGPVGG